MTNLLGAHKKQKKNTDIFEELNDDRNNYKNNKQFACLLPL